MKRTLTLVLLAALLVAGSMGTSVRTARADDTLYTEGTLYYTIANQSITIVGCFSRSADVRVPAMIAGIPVNAIATGAFANNTYVNTVYLPDTICIVQPGAFASWVRVVYNANTDHPQDTPTDLILGLLDPSSGGPQATELPAEPQATEPPAEPQATEPPAEPQATEPPAEPQATEPPAEPQATEPPAEPQATEPPASPTHSAGGSGTADVGDTPTPTPRPTSRSSGASDSTLDIWLSDDDADGASSDSVFEIVPGGEEPTPTPAPLLTPTPEPTHTPQPLLPVVEVLATDVPAVTPTSQPPSSPAPTTAPAHAAGENGLLILTIGAVCVVVLAAAGVLVLRRRRKH